MTVSSRRTPHAPGKGFERAGPSPTPALGVCNKRWRMGRSFIHAAFAAAAVLSGAAHAAYPERPVQIVVPYVAGGPTDLTARLIAQGLSQRMKEQFLVVNKGGAGGNLGAEFVARSTPDGYTLLVIGAAHAVNVSLYSQLRYDIKKDFTPVALWTTAPLVLLANTGFAPSSVQELVAAARADPDAISYASQGNGTAPHLAMERLKAESGTQMVHVPYRGSAHSLSDMMAGQVAVGFDSLVMGQQYTAAGKLKALAVTGQQRSRVLPDVPTMKEAGYPSVDSTVWYGLAAPAGTPAEIVDVLNENIRAVLRDPEVVKQLEPLGVDVADTTPSQFRSFLSAEIDKWAEAVAASGAKVD